MKTLYSILSSFALLASLPALAAPLAEKAVESKAREKECPPHDGHDTIHVDKAAPRDASSPICRGGGG